MVGFHSFRSVLSNSDDIHDWAEDQREEGSDPPLEHLMVSKPLSLSLLLIYETIWIIPFMIMITRKRGSLYLSFIKCVYSYSYMSMWHYYYYWCKCSILDWCRPFTSNMRANPVISTFEHIYIAFYETAKSSKSCCTRQNTLTHIYFVVLLYSNFFFIIFLCSTVFLLFNYDAGLNVNGRLNYHSMDIHTATAKTHSIIIDHLTEGSMYIYIYSHKTSSITAYHCHFHEYGLFACAYGYHWPLSSVPSTCLTFDQNIY